jgi:hypothetical protein
MPVVHADVHRKRNGSHKATTERVEICLRAVLWAVCFGPSALRRADHAALEELWCVPWRVAPNEQVALALRILDTLAGEIEEARIDFDADEGPAEFDAGDARGGGPHEGVAHGLAGVAAPIDQPIEMDLGAVARVSVGRPVIVAVMPDQIIPSPWRCIGWTTTTRAMGGAL